MKSPSPRLTKCTNCKEVINKPLSHTSRHKNSYCNRNCYLEAIKKNKELTGNWRDKMLEIACKKCGKVFTRRFHKKLPKYCSLKCAANDQDRGGEKHWNWKGGKDTRYIKKTAPRPRPELCEICGMRGKKRNGIVVDHNHETHKFRGWLCSNCNTALGLVNENTKTLQSMIDYLNENSL